MSFFAFTRLLCVCARVLSLIFLILVQNNRKTRLKDCNSVFQSEKTAKRPLSEKGRYGLIGRKVKMSGLMST